MAPNSRGLGSHGYYGIGGNPVSAISGFRPKEKYLIFLVLATFLFVCFSAVFFLPEKLVDDKGGNANKVYRVYKGLQDAGRDFILPAPPVATLVPIGKAGTRKDPESVLELNPNVRHGEHGAADPHILADKSRLLAQIELDEQIKALRQKQQQRVLPKPNIIKPNNPAHKNSGNLNPQINTVNNVYDDGKMNQKSIGRTDNTAPLIIGGEDASAADKRNHVKGMMLHAWNGYVKYAWGANEVKPISKRGHSASVFGSAQMGATIVDAMDTLYIMGLQDEFSKGRQWIEQSLDFNHVSGEISVFETNIRYVGGLLSLYSFTGDEMFKEKAIHVVDKLMPAFKTPTGIPYALINMRTGTAKNFGWASGGSSILSEFGTLHMEFAYLSDITGNPKYVKAVEKVRTVVATAERPKTLYPNYLNPKTGKWGQQHTSVGALGDSFYEYLLKEWLRSGKRDKEAKRLFDEAALDIEKQLVKKSPSGLTYIAEYKYGRTEDKMDHLACFAGGMYALAAHEEKDENSANWMNIGAGITNTCHEAYDRTDTKLGPEAFRFSNAMEARALKQNERYYILRPETFEAYFIMWRLTHEQKYRDWAWEAIQALDKHCKVEGGYTGIKNVYQVNSQKDDVQQSFFLAESLKYLYLIFSDDNLISLDQWVFNTEAHPLPIKGMNSYYRPSISIQNKEDSEAL